jgi:hypothetical protein
MAQMPIQYMSGRADAYLAALSSQPAPKVPAPSAPPAYLVDPGGISGGALRPGALDQAEFRKYLAQAQKESVTAPPAPIKPPAASGIPTLTPAQFAALGAVEEPGPVQQPAAAEPAASPATESPGAPAPSAPVAEAAPAVSTATPAAAEAAAPAVPAATQHASAERGPIPGSHRGADGVWELPRLPDKDERDLLRGQKWRVVESQQARELFLGPDGKFGWDDFVDLINPLQHIPFLNIAYRAVTGDQIYGAARMVDLAFGPAAGVSTAVDLAVQSTTGGDLVDNAVAALFGTGHDKAGDVASINTASGGQQLAAAGLIRHGSNQ